MISTRLLLATVSSVLSLPGLVLAQSSSACLPIGTGGAFGCQSNTAPTLTNGVVATGDVEFLYDAATAILTVVVENSSPVVSGETNPVITRIGFNFPAGAVSSATLVSQTGTGGSTPAFTLQYVGSQSIKMACFGDFSALLSIQNVQGGIGNAAATVFPHSNVVLGPVSFDLQLAGPSVGTLSANAIATTLSQNGSRQVAVGTKFQGGGIGGAESGWVSSGGICCLNQAAVVSVGTGCAPATSTIPTLSSVALPVPGGAIGVDISSPSTPNAFGLLVYGFSSTFDPSLNLPLPVDLGAFGFPGCALNVSSEFPIGVVVDGNGDGTHSFNIPALAKWCEREISFQVFFLSANTELLTSAGLTEIIGN